MAFTIASSCSGVGTYTRGTFGGIVYPGGVVSHGKFPENKKYYNSMKKT